jgi:hypothetical protein
MGKLIDLADKRLDAKVCCSLLSAVYLDEMLTRGIKMTRVDFEADLRIIRRYPRRIIDQTLCDLEVAGMVIPDRNQTG